MSIPLGSVKEEREASYVGQREEGAKLQLSHRTAVQLARVAVINAAQAGSDTARKEGKEEGTSVSLTHPSGRPRGVRALTPADGRGSRGNSRFLTA